MRAFSIFLNFLWIGCFCFGGPPAHIALFQRQFVEKKGWLSAHEFGHLLALSQFLPGPSSSQLGFSIGKAHGGLIGGVAAFLGFTLPSFIIMFLVAHSIVHSDMSDGWQNTALRGLQWFALVVVFDAVLSMTKHYCTNFITRQFAIFMLFFTLLTGVMAVVGLVLAAILGAFLLHQKSAAPHFDAPKQTNYWHLLWLLPFALIPLFELGGFSLVNMAAGFFNSGALVFGGGHVILPLLQQEFANHISTDDLLTGYAVAQALPGPIFALAAYMGPLMLPEYAFWAAVLGTLALFLPGFLLVLAAEPYWRLLATNTRIAAAAKGINAAVVGLLGAILINPLLVTVVGWPTLSLNSVVAIAIVSVGFVLLRYRKLPVLVLLALMLLSAFGVAAIKL